MDIFLLVLKNAVRQKLRSILTIVGIAIAVLAFGLLRTVVTAWNAGVDASATDRLITRQAVSFIFPVPLAYKSKIERIPGVSSVLECNWFGGKYGDGSFFFSRIAVKAEGLQTTYPEYILTPEENKAFIAERTSCVVGEKLAQQLNLKIGDRIPIEGDIYPGTWVFTVRGIYKPKFKEADATQMFFHWDYLSERLKQEGSDRGTEVGWYTVRINDPARAAEISSQIDREFANSAAETKTETERAFTQGFISSAKAIFTAINVVSFVIIGIIMLVLANTMVMTARERTREYAVLKTLGFENKHLIAFITGEAIIVSLTGAVLGILLTFPLVDMFGEVMPKGWFPVFFIEPSTLIMSFSAALVVGVLSALIPVFRALRTSIVDGLRYIG